MHTEKLSNLFTETFPDELTRVALLPESGSNRKYYLLSSEFRNVIGTYGPESKENEAFIYLSEHFRSKGVNVPKILAQDLDQNIYLQEDLGHVSLYSYVKSKRVTAEFPDELVTLYKKVIDGLVEIQTNGAKKLNFSVCYPRKEFDKQSILWDLNYFKYNFLKLAGITFDEQLLEDDFNKFINFLLDAKTKFFLFRDFQSRNIMVKDDEIYFIDYQGGRKGAVQYDLASLLFDAKAEIPQEKREELKEYYTTVLEKETGIKPKEFNKYYDAYALVRVLQAMGAYGYRGFFERKEHFLQSIPPALENLKLILHSAKFIKKLPELKRVLELLPESEKLKQISHKRLKVSVKSFSYKRGFPYDPSGNGGGHIFDCRFMDNPGRIEQYKKLCGKDQPVIDYLEKQGEAEIFLKSTLKLSKTSIQKYIDRGFSNFSISYGCTGGQHRSVYCAERTTAFLKENFDIDVELLHTEGY